MNITSIHDANGVIQKGQRSIAQVAQDYFQNLYSSNGYPLAYFGKVFQNFQARVTEEMNEDLTAPVTKEEVRAAIFDIGAYREPGLD